MLAIYIDRIGVRETARACGVSANAPNLWKKHGLPQRTGRCQGRRAHYEKCIARKLGMPVQELRRVLREEDEVRSAA